MSSKYYYLVASLPTFQLDSKPPIAISEFLQLCQEHLKAQDFSALEQALAEEGVDVKQNSLAGRWLGINHNLKNEMAFFRARRAGKNPTDYIRGERPADSVYADVVAQAGKAADPLASEKIFDQFRWQFLDEAARFNYFDLEWLIVYALKLKMLERYQLVASPQGREAYEKLKKIEISLK